MRRWVKHIWLWYRALTTLVFSKQTERELINLAVLHPLVKIVRPLEEQSEYESRR